MAQRKQHYNFSFEFKIILKSLCWDQLVGRCEA